LPLNGTARHRQECLVATPLGIFLLIALLAAAGVFL
jgi:hypothetical protein